MTAEGTALNGAGEAPKAELAAAKVAAPAEERPAEEREGVGGPFVIVNGDSDGGLSDRGSDKADSRSDEEDLPPTNAGPDADSDHGTAGGESAASDATVGLPSSNGHGGRPAVESEDGAGEGKSEGSDNSEDGPGEQGTDHAGGELGGEDAPVEVGIHHADAGADSATPGVDSTVNGKGSEKETSAAADHAGGELSGEDALEEVGVDHADAGSDSAAPAVDSIVNGKESEKETSAAAAADHAGGELSGEDAPEEVGIDHADDGADSATPAVDSIVNVKESEKETSAAADHTGGELGGEDALEEVGIDHADAGADSTIPDVDSVVHGKELEKETSVAAPEEQQGGASAAVESSSPDDTPTQAESGPIVLESQGSGEQSNGEEVAAEIVELSTDGSGVSKVNGQHDADMSVDSCVTATEPVIQVDEGKQQQSTITEVVEQDGSNGHAYVEPIADSSTSAPEFDTDGGEGQQTEAPKTEPEVSDGSDCGPCKGPIEEEVAANGLGSAEDTADTSAELEPAVNEVEGEVACGVVETEQVIIGDDGEGDLHDGHADVAVSSEEKAEPPAKEGMDESIAPEAGVCVITGNLSEQIVRDDVLVKNDVSSGILQSEQSEPDQVVKPKADQEVQVEVTAGDGNMPVSDVKAEMNKADCTQTQDLGSELEDRSIPLHENLSGEVEEEVNEQACPEDAHLALNDHSSIQTGKHEQLELPGAGVADKSDNVVVEAEPRKEVETEVVDVVPLHVPAPSTDHNEPRSVDFINNDRINHLNPNTELESSDDVQARECSSQEISSTTVDQVISGVSGEHGTAVTDDAELRSKAGDASLEISSEGAVDQGEPVALGENKAAVADEVKPSSATGSESDVVCEASDICQTSESRDFTAVYQSNNDQPDIFDTSTTCEELVSPVEGLHLSDVTLEPGVKAPCTAQEMGMSDETCKDVGMSDVTCKDVENINACNISSQDVETKCLEVLEHSSVDGVVPAEHKNDEKNAERGKENIAENSSESPMDLDRSHKGDITFTGQPNLSFIVKVPRLAGDDVWERVQEAQAHLDRLTQERDALNVRKREQKAVFDGYREKLEAARQEESQARAAFVDKRTGLDSARSVIGKLNQANSVDEIDELIARKEKTMEHETISLKQEKLFIKEINELKARRKQVCSNLGSEAEITEAFHQKDHIHEQHKTLKKEADLLSKNLKSLEENRKKIQTSFEDERAILRKLNDELHAANVIRQQAYENWVVLRAEPNKKNKYFRMYMKDRNAVSKYQPSRDMDGLKIYCNNQVENFMKMWNKDDDFRMQYIEANKISTLRRFGTPDGRSLGPEEDPPVIPRNNFTRRPNNPSQLTASSPNVPVTISEAAPEKSAAVVVPVEEDSFPVLPPTQIHKQAKPKTAGGSSQKEMTTAPASEVEDVKENEKEKARRMVEELELARKAEELARKEEELRQQRAAAEKEQLVLEQKAKAKEAEERKKRQAQKALERAEQRAIKEAEIKERKRRQRLDRKELVNGSGEGNSAAIATADTESNASENARDSEVPQQVAPRRTISRPAAAVRQLNKLEPRPEPLRNKSKKKTRQYFFIGVAVAIALILAWRSLDLPGSSFFRF